MRSINFRIKIPHTPTETIPSAYAEVVNELKLGDEALVVA